jgi:hypothetical protein
LLSKPDAVSIAEAFTEGLILEELEGLAPSFPSIFILLDKMFSILLSVSVDIFICHFYTHKKNNKKIKKNTDAQ